MHFEFVVGVHFEASPQALHATWLLSRCCARLASCDVLGGLHGQGAARRTTHYSHDGLPLSLELDCFGSLPFGMVLGWLWQLATLSALERPRQLAGRLAMMATAH